TVWINPGWMDPVLNWKVTKWREAGEAETEIRRRIVAFRSPVNQAVAALVMTPLFGAIVAIFSTVWLNLRARRSA
ncbi:MAG TPA: hypothetical protein VFJ90_00715, partial [Candidatus Didemnitutus sp.]|nr:hypothetical protein [Candidatus Didemnitutus sp.]